MPRTTRIPVLGGLLALAGAAACEAPPLPTRSTIDEPQFLTFRCVTRDGDGGRQIGVPVGECGCVERVEADGEVKFRRLGRVECGCRAVAAPTPGGAERHPCFDGRDNDGDGASDADDADCAETDGVEGDDGVCANGRDDDGDGLVDRDDPDCEPADLEDALIETRVRWVEAECTPVVDDDGCQTGWDCSPRFDPEAGDWIPRPGPGDRGPATPGGAGCPPVPPRPQAVACEPSGAGELRAYVGATRRGEVAVLDLSDDNRIDDVDRSIPGATAVFVDDLISDVGAHPYGDFVFTVNSTTGSLAVIRDDRDVRVAYKVEIAAAPLLEAVVWPDPTRILPETGLPPPVAWVAAPLAAEIVEIDLDALGRVREVEPGAITPPGGDVIRRIITLEAATPDAPPPRPGRLAVHPDGRTLYVGHVEAPLVTAIDLEDPRRRVTLSLAPAHPCEDDYLVGVLDPEDRDACVNGRDDDGDGLADADDPDCAAGRGWENWEGDAWVPACSRPAECGDGVDNDGDGVVDADDPDCAADFRWERPTPACADGADNDDDGLVDRADPDCTDEADDNEAGRELSTCVNGRDDDGDGLADADDPECAAVAGAGAVGEPRAGLPEEDGSTARSPDRPDGPAGPQPCRNGVDDDGDGLVDADDPGCTDPHAERRYDFEAPPECGNGADDDGDGRADFGEDPDCYAASDASEGTGAVRLGPTALLAAEVPVAGGTRGFVYAVDRLTGDPFAIEVDADGWPLADARPQRIRVPGTVQSITLRQLAYAASLPYVDDRFALRSIEITAPVPVLDQDGRDVYARLVDDAQACGRSDRRIEGFYVVEDGTAWAVDDPALEPFVGRCHGQDRLELEVPAGTPVRSRVPGGGAPAVLFPVVDADRPGSNPRGAFDPQVFVGGPTPVRQVLHDQLNLLRTALDRLNSATTPGFRLDDDATRYDPEHHPAFCRLESPLEVSTCFNGNDDDGDGQADADDPDCALDGIAGGTEPLPEEDGAGVARDPDDADAPTGDHPCRNGTDDDGDGLVDADDPGCTFPAAAAGGDPSTSACIPAGYTAQGRPEPASAFLERTRHRVDASEAIQVLEEDPARLPGGRWAVTYEGVLPHSESRSGQFGARLDENTWTLLDYDRNFCRIGVQPGDVLLIDRMVPASEDFGSDETAALCRSLQRALEAEDPRRLREPLRYEVVDVTAHKLTLRTDTREAYTCQRPRDPRTPLPQLLSPPPAPARECAAQLIAYRLRAGNDQWIVTIGDTFPHPLVDRDGQCVPDARRVDLKYRGRVRLGEVFENTWVRFKLGHAPFDEPVCEAGDGSAPTLPYMVGARYEFALVPGAHTAALADVALLPREMGWLPFDDRLYIVDSAFRTVVEVTGLDLHRVVGGRYRTPPGLRVIRRFE